MSFFYTLKAYPSGLPLEGKVGFAEQNSDEVVMQRELFIKFLSQI